MGGERNHRSEMDASDDTLTELAVRLALLSAQRPARATECVATTSAARLYAQRTRGDANA
ncbi:MAG: hypothetical protein WAU75_08625 [Solirubrobacteraceae bacterium]